LIQLWTSTVYLQNILVSRAAILFIMREKCRQRPAPMRGPDDLLFGDDVGKSSPTFNRFPATLSQTNCIRV